MVLRVFFVIFFVYVFTSFPGESIDIFSEKASPLSRIGVILSLPGSPETLENDYSVSSWFGNSKRTLEGKRTYYSGDFFGKYVVISSLWPNKVSASVIACNMIFKHRVDLIIILGTCYSRSENGHFGDLLITEGYINYDSDMRPFFPRFEIPDICQSVFTTHAGYREAAKIGGKQFILDHKKSIEDTLKTYGYLKPKTSSEHALVEGIIATGESFTMSKNYFLSLQKMYPSIQGFDSAGGAIAQVCYEYDVPCLGVSILLPHPLESPSNEDWKILHSQTNKMYMNSLLKSLLQEICSIH
ncbi:5'-methylthioadenosine/S-adenosylhomocysteine nucleosidase [Chlamydia avium]|uniref:Phosphorylase superfamily protein n=1 Tax=Chlamydia avium TaxID=1457141 RepID=A0ABP2X6A9_9CHLA|nr:phosphorylase superfamily protein [Chlamydia avium]EPP36661.1 phosphorylase superfamily protein [Chlamydia psittaci 10_743_SC13]EPP38343.1 phosphorylase superfamily protein [Chlamydia avium]VVT42843.1 5'-methylthioadenosine/S-adenosylhomocysteine nucleosidase [Chlamydia avium]